MAQGVEDTAQYSLTISDLGDYYVPGQNDGYDVRAKKYESVHVHNEQDQDATVTVEGTHQFDETADETVDVQQVTVAAAGGTAVVPVPRDEVHGYLRVHVTFATAPTGNNPITITFAADE